MLTVCWILLLHLAWGPEYTGILVTQGDLKFIREVANFINSNIILTVLLLFPSFKELNIR